MKILVFGGTTEGREFAKFLVSLGTEVTLSCATDYGEELVKDIPGVEVQVGRLDEAGMSQLIQSCGAQAVVDTTHPFAGLVSDNIRRASDQSKVDYYRLLRAGIKDQKEMLSPGVHWVDSMESAIKILNEQSGNIFLTTGSKNLEEFTQVTDFRERVWLRVIPMVDSLEKALALGYAAKRIICMQGPFSESLNEAMFRAAKSQFVVTKESGSVGGFQSKVKAAQAMGAEVIAVMRPIEKEGYEWSQLSAIFRSLLT